MRRAVLDLTFVPSGAIALTVLRQYTGGFPRSSRPPPTIHQRSGRCVSPAPVCQGLEPLTLKTPPRLSRSGV